MPILGAWLVMQVQQHGVPTVPGSNGGSLNSSNESRNWSNSWRRPRGPRNVKPPCSPRERPSGDPKKPGRKSGANYGPKAHRPLPEQKPDEIIDVPLPEQCPECGGQADEDHIDQQFQVEIPSQPIVRRFDIQGLLDEAFGISLSRGGAAQVVLRVADWRSGWTVCSKGTSRITATASFKSTWLGIAIRS